MVVIRLFTIIIKKHPKLLGIILASAPDMLGSHFLFQPDYKQLLKEAKENVDNGNKTKLLHKMIEDYMYISSETYYNWYNENSNLDNLPVLGNSSNWEQFSSINIPIFTFSGTNDLNHYLHLDLLKEKATNCPDFEYKYIDGADHFYHNKETEIGKLVLNWIEKIK